MKILVIAPHPDDEVLGCGGLIARNVSEGNEVYVCVVTKACAPLYDESLDIVDKKECKEAHSILGVKETLYLDFPAAMLDSFDKNKLNVAFIELFKKIQPDEVYLPHRGDMHLDHKIIVDSCMVALRPKYSYKVKSIYAYETLSETDWDIPNVSNAFVPNVYFDITGFIDKKIKAMEAYKSQICEYPNPRSKEGIKALAMHRGCNMGLEYAEAFMLIRQVA